MTNLPPILHNQKTCKAILTCSKAPRGLFVQVEVGRVFTAIAISPSRGSRQLLTRYAFRAGRNLPDTVLLLISIKIDDHLFSNGVLEFLPRSHNRL